MLSFNVLPGWRLEQIVRDICAAEDPALDPETNAKQAIAHLNAIAAGTPENTPYGFLVRQAAQRLANANPSYMLGEYLAPVNKCFLFEDVLRRARKADMHYVSEPELATSLPERVLPSNAAKARALANGDAAKLQSILDAMSGRSFRRAIFSKHPPRGEPDPKVLNTLHASLSLQRDTANSRSFRTGTGQTYTAPSDEIADAVADLTRIHPAIAAVAELAVKDRGALEDALMLLASSGYLRLQATPLRVGRASGVKPIADEVARLEARDQKSWVTTRHHLAVAPSSDAMALVPHLDGTRDRSALAELLQGADRPARVEGALKQLEQAALLQPEE
ncbi:MAG: methyltransferase regulatory domain-containing protein [Proteobacteria bacterium]|nr:methyltransferase regulatory domain-containing protein [Pseudomonadota bacterium]